MATGRNNKLVGATGEYLVAAELCRRELIATTFTGNVPDYDIVATDGHGRHVAVQVKAIRRGSWQFGNVTNFFAVRFRGKKQMVGKNKLSPLRGLIIVLVFVDPKAADRFYILSWESLRDALRKDYTQFLKKHGGKRPNNWRSLHCALPEKSLGRFRDWGLIKKSLR